MADFFTWESEVRGYELDSQGIVNNANYLHYFDQARIKHFKKLNIDWDAWHKKGYNLVLAHTNLSFKYPLKAHDQFYVTSSFKRSGKLRLIFYQEIFKNEDNRLVSKAENTIVCVHIKSGRPAMPEELNAELSAINN